ncbi:MAG: OmpH family outer membrane protein, partial [Gammaproteobacteria bacterium]|nr:OmpH family outer membrane protein [Gammaproteobacteria bacterium]
MNRFERFSIILPLLFVLSMSMSYAADYKLGVVNAPKILEASPQADAARKKLEKEFATRDRDLVASQKDLKGLEDRFTKDGAIMSETERT